MKIQEFIKSIAGLSTNTRRVYEQSLWQLNNVIAGDEPTEIEILGFLNTYPSASLHRHKAAIRAYFEFQGKTWPFTKRQFTQRRQRVPRYVRPDLVKGIAEAAEDRDDYMLVWTLFQLGCRINELMEITGDAISPTGILVVTKGGSQKLKRVTKAFYEELKEYAGSNQGKIFPHAYAYYRKRLKYLGNKVGVEVTPHMLRHSRAVDLLNKGMQLPYVQQFLGHRNINTTAIYLEITGGELTEHLERVENNVHPIPGS